MPTLKNKLIIKVQLSNGNTEWFRNIPAAKLGQKVSVPILGRLQVGRVVDYGRRQDSPLNFTPARPWAAETAADAGEAWLTREAPMPWDAYAATFANLRREYLAGGCTTETFIAEVEQIGRPRPLANRIEDERIRIEAAARANGGMMLALRERKRLAREAVGRELIPPGTPIDANGRPLSTVGSKTCENCVSLLDANGREFSVCADPQARCAKILSERKTGILSMTEAEKKDRLMRKALELGLDMEKVNAVVSQHNADFERKPS